MDDKGNLKFQPGQFADGLLAAHQAGAIDSGQLKTLLGKATDADKAFADQQALQARVGADGFAKAKAVATGAARGGAFLAGAIPAGTAAAEAGLVLGPLGSFVAGGLGALAGGFISEHAASAVGNELAKHSDTIHSFKDAANALPEYDAAGNLISLVVPGGVGLAKLGKVAAIRGAAVAGGDLTAGAAIAQTAKEVGGAALAGAGFEAAVRPAFDYTLNAGKQALGITPEQEATLPPSTKSILESAILGVAFSNLGTKFKNYSTEDLVGLLSKPKADLSPADVDAVTAAGREIQKATARQGGVVGDPADFKFKVEQALAGNQTRAISSELTGTEASGPANALPPSPAAPTPPGGTPAPQGQIVPVEPDAAPIPGLATLPAGASPSVSNAGTSPASTATPDQSQVPSVPETGDTFVSGGVRYAVTGADEKNVSLLPENAPAGAEPLFMPRQFIDSQLTGGSSQLQKGQSLPPLGQVGDSSQVPPSDSATHPAASVEGQSGQTAKAANDTTSTAGGGTGSPQDQAGKSLSPESQVSSPDLTTHEPNTQEGTSLQPSAAGEPPAPQASGAAARSPAIPGLAEATAGRDQPATVTTAADQRAVAGQDGGNAPAATRERAATTQTLPRGGTLDGERFTEADAGGRPGNLSTIPGVDQPTETTHAPTTTAEKAASETPAAQPGGETLAGQQLRRRPRDLRERVRLAETADLTTARQHLGAAQQAHAGEIEHLGATFEDTPGTASHTGISLAPTGEPTIHHNPPAFARSAEAVRQAGGDAKAWASSAVQEELIHHRDVRASGDRFDSIHSRIYTALPKEARDAIAQVYPDNRNPVILAAEYVRALAQHRAGASVTESHFRDTKPLEAILAGPQPQAVEEHLAKMQALAPVPQTQPQNDRGNEDQLAHSPPQTRDGTARATELPHPSSPASDLPVRQSRETVQPNKSLSSAQETPATKFRQGDSAIYRGRAATINEIEGGRATITLRPTATMKGKVVHVGVGDLKPKPVRTFMLPDAPQGSSDVIDLIEQNGGIIGKGEAERRAKGKGLTLSSEYDDVPNLKGIYQQRVFGGSQEPNQMAAMLHDEHGIGDGSTGAMYAAIDQAMTTRKSARADSVRQAKLEQQSENFQRDAETPGKKKKEIHAGNLNVGDVVSVGGEKLRVIDVDPDTEDIVLEDHAKYGVQTVGPAGVLFVERVRRATGSSDFAPLDKDPSGASNLPSPSTEDQSATVRPPSSTQGEQQSQGPSPEPTPPAPDLKLESVTGDQLDAEREKARIKRELEERKNKRLSGKEIDTTGDFLDPLASDNPLFSQQGSSISNRETSAPKISDAASKALDTAFEGLFAANPQKEDQTETPAFKAWSEGLPVVNQGDEIPWKGGFVMNAYHGTLPSRGEFNVFEHGATAKDAFQLSFHNLSPGWFTTNPEQASRFGKRIINGFVKMKRPLVLSGDAEAMSEFADRRADYHRMKKEFNGDQRPEWYWDRREMKKWDGLREEFEKSRASVHESDPFTQLKNLAKEAMIEHPDVPEGEAIRLGLVAQGYDGIVLEGTAADTAPAKKETNIWAIPLNGGAQIKDVENNSGDFDPSNPSILRAANPANVAQEELPPDKIGPFVAAAQALISSGIDTPEAMAAVLDAKFQGRARKYSEALWDAFGMAKKALRGNYDWTAIYSKLDQGARSPSGTSATDNATAPSQARTDQAPSTSPSRTAVPNSLGASTRSESNPQAASPSPDVDTAKEPAQGEPHDRNRRPNLEPDRQDAGLGERGSADQLPVQRGEVGQDGERLDAAGEADDGDRSPGGPMSADVPSVAHREASNPELRESAPGTGERAAGSERRAGSGGADAAGASPDGRTNAATPYTAGVPALAQTLDAGGQDRGDTSAPTGWHPTLAPEQVVDGQVAERRLFEKAKPGFVLTNSTGTGKTFSGLGIVKRRLDAGEENILVVAPSDKIGSDWVQTAKDFFGIPDIAQLEGTKDNGPEYRVVVTTYANLGQNASLVQRPWGMIVADEAHYLSQAQDGKQTNALDTFRALTFHRQGGLRRAEMMEPEATATLQRFAGMIRDRQQLSEAQLDEQQAAHDKIKAVRAQFDKERTTRGDAGRPKALMLSATPFAYHFSLDYGEGYLFDHGPEPKDRGYNTPSARGQFYMDNFGYRMRTGKLTQPENATATGILERRFAEKLMKDGAMAGRSLQVPFDYSRQFVLTESQLGGKIDEVMKALEGDKELGALKPFLPVGDYLSRRYLLEALKARDSIPRIQEHLAMGRKVVVFYDYNKGGATNPLRPTFTPGQKETISTPNGPQVVDLSSAYRKLAAQISGFDDVVKQLDSLESPIELFRREFPAAGIFNGKVSKIERRRIVDAFNTSGGEMNVMLVQRASGKEGISLQDRDRKHQRVLIDLGIPGRPTDAIQTEGRINRHGMQSNGIMEYLTTGTDFERWTFAQTIAQRASTAENLAMGERARNLLQAFASGYNDAEASKPGTSQGTGGKQRDAALENGDPYKNAVALYYTNAKKTQRNKAQEGIDYFPTPEPLAFKMVEWAGIKPGEDVLEPSAGHGAIARFFPDSVNKTGIEPSNELGSRLALNAPDINIRQQRFEDHHVSNKYDAIVMNPPFGTGGRTAVDHIIKAAQHLREGGRIVALLPEGSATQKFEKWYDDAPGIYMSAEYGLPAVAFERAGTSVKARVVVLDKLAKPESAPQEQGRRDIGGDTITEFFDALANQTVPERQSAGASPANTENQPSSSEPRQSPAGQPSSQSTPSAASQSGPSPTSTIPTPTRDSNFSPADFLHTKTGEPVFVAKPERRFEQADFARHRARAKEIGGNYSLYNKDGAIPGFHFKTAEERDQFIGQHSHEGTNQSKTTPTLRASNAAVPDEGASESPESSRRFAAIDAEKAVRGAFSKVGDNIGYGFDLSQSDEHPESSGFWVNPSGEIEYNPDALARSMGAVHKAGGDAEAWVASAMEEEVWHMRDVRASSPSFQPSHRALVGKIPSEALRELRRLYGVDLQPADAAAEYLRMLAQRRAGNPITESHFRDTSRMDAILDRAQHPAIIAHVDAMLDAGAADGEGSTLYAANPMQAAKEVYDQAADEYASLDQKDQIKSGYDSANNIPEMRGEQAGTKIRLDFVRPHPADEARAARKAREAEQTKDEDAMPYVIEAGHKAANLAVMRQKIATSVDPKLAKDMLPGIDHAIANFARLNPLRLVNHDTIMAAQHAKLKAADVTVGEVENYVTRKLDQPESVKEMLPNPLFSMGGGQAGGARYFTKGRSFETLADAIHAGYRPKSTNLAELDRHRITAGERILEQKAFINRLKATPSPTDGKPIVGKYDQRTTLSGGTERQAPPGYTTVRTTAGEVPIHNQFAHLFKDLYGDSAARRLTLFRGIMKAAALTKQYTLLLDTFHIGRLLYKMAVAGGGAPVTFKNGKPEWNIRHGLALIEYDDADLGRAVAAGEISKSDADYARTMRGQAEELLANGLNVGRVADNLVQQAHVHVPGLQGFNDWIFGKLSRAAMIQTALTGFEKNLANFPERTRVENARQTAKEMNELFGNLQNQGLFTNKTFQDIARLIFLAPQWTESQLRYELRAYGQFGRGIYDAIRGPRRGGGNSGAGGGAGGGNGGTGNGPGSPIGPQGGAGGGPRGKRFRLGNAARAMAAGLAALFAVNQVINYLSRGQFTWANEEDDHKLDAFIPGGKRGFWFNPFEIAGEYAHAAFKYAAQHENPVDIASHVVSNKLSPIARGAKDILTGRDYSGRHYLDNGDRFRAGIIDALPSPIPLGGALEKDPRQPLGYRLNRQPGSVEKQLLASVGLKTSNAQSPRSQMFALAQPFRADRAGSDSAGEYTEARRAADNSDEDSTQSEIKWLLERGKSISAIERAFGISRSAKDGSVSVRPEVFTGSADAERQFVASLTPEQAKVYAQAQADHVANAQKLLTYSANLLRDDPDARKLAAINSASDKARVDRNKAAKAPMHAAPKPVAPRPAPQFAGF